MINKKEVTTNEIMEMLVKMKTELFSQMATKDDLSRMATKADFGGLKQRIDVLDKKFESKFDQLDKKFESKFDLLFDAIGDITEKFTIMDYKFLQLKRQVHAT